MTTNNMEELLLADKIIILEKGCVKAIIKKEKLLNKMNILKKAKLPISFILEILLLLKKKEIKIKNFEEKEILKVLEENL